MADLVAGGGGVTDYGFVEHEVAVDLAGAGTKPRYGLRPDSPLDPLPKWEDFAPMARDYYCDDDKEQESDEGEPAGPF